MTKRQPDDTQPFLNHDTLTQAQQARHLGVSQETVMNLGHPVPISEIERHPAPRVHDYQNNSVSQKIVDGPERSVGVYQRFSDPKDGRSTAENLAKWSGYAHSNSYDGKDPRGRGQGSDGHLAPLPSPSTSNWANYTAGGDSGEGRLQKIGKR